jgi:ParB/RepB/Spo0J family partition protein
LVKSKLVAVEEKESMIMDIRTILIDSIVIPEGFCRQNYDNMSLEELQESIAVMGLLQPIDVTIQDKHFVLVDGSRRLKCLKKLNIARVSAVVLTLDEIHQRGASLVANIQRDALNPLEEAEAVRSLLDDLKVGIPALSRILGKSQSWIKSRIDITRMPVDVLDALGKEKVTIGVALELSGIESEAVRKEYVRCASLGGCTKEMARQWVQQYELDQGSIYNRMGSEGEDIISETFERKVILVCDVCSGQVQAVDLRIIRACVSCFGAVREAVAINEKTDGET